MIKIKLSGSPEEISQAQEYFQRLEDIGEIRICKIVDSKKFDSKDKNQQNMFIQIEPEAIELLEVMSEKTLN